MEQLKLIDIEEGKSEAMANIERLITGLLFQIEDHSSPTLRHGLQDTPSRVAKAYATWFGGYDVDIAELFKVFEDGAEGANELVIVRDIPVYSHCEHHMAPIIGRATVGYVPNGKIVGLSKLSRVVDAFARRLQVQERLTNQIADAVYEHLNAKAVCVYIDARHMCMESRGVKQSCGSSTVTKAFRGATAGEYSGVHPLWSTEGLMWRKEFLEACK